jgi:hypothetical protein
MPAQPNMHFAICYSIYAIAYYTPEKGFCQEPILRNPGNLRGPFHNGEDLGYNQAKLDPGASFVNYFATGHLG